MLQIPLYGRREFVGFGRLPQRDFLQSHGRLQLEADNAAKICPTDNEVEQPNHRHGTFKPFGVIRNTFRQASDRFLWLKLGDRSFKDWAALNSKVP